jgi:Phosphatidylglycerophosphate synthase
VRKVPAVLSYDRGTGNLKIAGLSVIDRMVIAAHRAGCAPISVISETDVQLPRAQALDVEIAFVREAPAPTESVLMIDGSVLVESGDLKRVIEADGRLTTADGASLPVRMNVPDPQPIVALGVAESVSDGASARTAERKLWTSLGSSADGLIDRYLNRPVGRLLSKLLIHTSISPNTVSVVSILIGVASAPFFASGDFVTGALLLQLCAIVDCVDGELARALFKQSPLGKWLDIGGDQVVHFSVFAAIGIGVARVNPTIPALELGVSAALGVLLCFPVIIRGLRQPAEQRGFLLNKLMESTANRDFTVLILFLALIGRMDLFLWMAGIGIHIFWITLLVLLTASRCAAPTVSQRSA